MVEVDVGEHVDSVAVEEPSLPPFVGVEVVVEAALAVGEGSFEVELVAFVQVFVVIVDAAV